MEKKDDILFYELGPPNSDPFRNDDCEINLQGYEIKC